MNATMGQMHACLLILELDVTFDSGLLQQRIPWNLYSISLQHRSRDRIALEDVIGIDSPLIDMRRFGLRVLIT